LKKNILVTQVQILVKQKRFWAQKQKNVFNQKRFWATTTRFRGNTILKGIIYW
jgi:hypothetical protein